MHQQYFRGNISALGQARVDRSLPGLLTERCGLGTAADLRLSPETPAIRQRPEATLRFSFTTVLTSAIAVVQCHRTSEGDRENPRDGGQRHFVAAEDAPAVLRRWKGDSAHEQYCFRPAMDFHTADAASTCARARCLSQWHATARGSPLHFSRELRKRDPRIAAAHAPRQVVSSTHPTGQRSAERFRPESCASCAGSAES